MIKGCDCAEKTGTYVLSLTYICYSYGFISIAIVVRAHTISFKYGTCTYQKYQNRPKRPRYMHISRIDHIFKCEMATLKIEVPRSTWLMFVGVDKATAGFEQGLDKVCTRTRCGVTEMGVQLPSSTLTHFSINSTVSSQN